MYVHPAEGSSWPPLFYLSLGSAAPHPIVWVVLGCRLSEAFRPGVSNAVQLLLPSFLLHFKYLPAISCQTATTGSAGLCDAATAPLPPLQSPNVQQISCCFPSSRAVSVERMMSLVLLFQREEELCRQTGLSLSFPARCCTK